MAYHKERFFAVEFLMVRQLAEQIANIRFNWQEKENKGG